MKVVTKKKEKIISHIKLKLFHYTPRRRLGGEAVYLLLIHDLGSRWG
jgi:hypothetical protein